MSRRFQLLFVCAVLASCSCGKSGPPVPPPPEIETFAASADSVAPGGQVTLSWKVSHAKELQLAEAHGGPVPGVSADQLEGSVTLTVNQDSVFVLTARGEADSVLRVINVRVPDSQPALVFRALPENISGGQSATLIWDAAGESDVRITYDADLHVDLAGQVQSGAVLVSPTKDVTYTLQAGGRSASVSVHVSPAISLFTAEVASPLPGEQVPLRWKTNGADTVKVSVEGRGDLYTETDPLKVASGSFADEVPLDYPMSGGVLAYTLTVTGSGKTVTQGLTVYVGRDVTIDRFEAPQYAKAGGIAVFSWRTTAADSVQLLLDGAVVYQSTSIAEAQQTSVPLPAPGEDFTVELRASNQRGDHASAFANVEALPPPSDLSFSVSPSSVAVGSPVTLSWSVNNARRIRVTDSFGSTVFSASGLAAEGGSTQLYPERDLTYTILADNLVGDPPLSASQAVTVSGSALLSSSSPGTPAVGTMVDLSYAADPTAALYGVPHSNVLTSTTADFADIRSPETKLQFTELDNDQVQELSLDFEGLLYGKRFNGPITVSTNGWLLFGSTSATLAADGPIPSAAAPYNFIAPFWDDLRLRPGAGVYARVFGESPDKILVVQWDDLQIGVYEASKVSFEVKVHQSGEVSFEYQSVILPSPTYTSYVVGVQGPTSTTGVGVTAKPVTNSGIHLFAPVVGPIRVAMQQEVRYGAQVRKGSNWMKLSGPRPVRLPTDVQIGEVMFAPAAAVPQGEWLELENRSEIPVDLTGWTLSASNGGSFIFDGGTTLQPHSVLVLGQSTDPSSNDDAGVQLAWGAGFSLPDTNGAVTLRSQPDAGHSVSWDAGFGGPGVSLTVDVGPFLKAGNSALQTQSCSGTATYGNLMPNQKGSPGASNACNFGYSMQPMPVGFYDLTAHGGTAVFGARYHLATGSFTLSSPVPFFKVNKTAVTVGSSGWLYFGTTPLAASANPAVPGAAPILGTIAPFWDDLMTDFANPLSDIYYKRVGANEDPAAAAPHWIVQWAHFTHWTAGDDLNFELKLFDDGTIEFHYGVMKSGNSFQYANGNGATVWIENPTGTQAITPFLPNSAQVQPNSAYRFSPR